MLCNMVPLLPPVNCVEDSWGWRLHATSAQSVNGRRDSRVNSMHSSPSRFFNPRVVRRWVHCVRVSSTGSHTGTCDAATRCAASEVRGSGCDASCGAPPAGANCEMLARRSASYNTSFSASAVAVMTGSQDCSAPPASIRVVRAAKPASIRVVRAACDKASVSLTCLRPPRVAIVSLPSALRMTQLRRPTVTSQPDDPTKEADGNDQVRQERVRDRR
jgi:hypothetical protein